MIHSLRFIGQDGSMGYRYGEIYNLKIVESVAFNRNIVVEPVGHPEMRCPYRDIHTFLANWANPVGA
jgi:hypothetical protein